MNQTGTPRKTRPPRASVEPTTRVAIDVAPATGAMAPVDADLWQALSGDPAEEVEAILVSAATIETLLAELPAEVTVGHRYRLINAISVQATAAALRRLARLPMIKRIESVRPVAACEQAAG